MLKRFICALTVIALGLSLWYVAYTTEDPDYTEISSGKDASDPSGEESAQLKSYRKMMIR